MALSEFHTNVKRRKGLGGLETKNERLKKEINLGKYVGQVLLTFPSLSLLFFSFSFPHISIRSHFARGRVKNFLSKEKKRDLAREFSNSTLVINQKCFTEYRENKNVFGSFDFFYFIYYSKILKQIRT